MYIIKQKEIPLKVKKMLAAVLNSNKSRIIPIKEISKITRQVFPVYAQLFSPRAVGHLVRSMGYQTYRKRDGYVIVK